MRNPFKKKQPKIEEPIYQITMGDDIPLLLFVGEYDPAKIEPIRNRGNFCKPYGGVWCSPFKPDTGSEWFEWCTGEQFKIPSLKDPVTFIKVNHNGKFFKINTLSNLRKLLAEFELKDNRRSKFMTPALDFERIAKVVDGIYLTSAGEGATRLSEPENLYGWDCETVLIFNSNAKY